MGVASEAGTKNLRVRVYSQERKDKAVDKAPKVARMVMQIWDRSFHRLHLDHPLQYNRGIVDFYLCYGGDPGGEQMFGTELVNGQVVKVNTIYIYRLDSFKDPVEMAREVAHEYGHAILPPVGGFKQPEIWADGYLGEKLFLQWIRNDMSAGKLNPDDAMGANLGALNTWVEKNVDPLVQRAGTQGPALNAINESAGGMEAFEGLALYVEAICPAAVFVRSLTYTSDAQKGKADLTPPLEYPDNVVLAASEMENWTLSVPKALFDTKKPIWIPLGKGSCTGANVITKAKNGWAQVMPMTPNIIIKNPPIG
jgi:hypothetical protein